MRPCAAVSITCVETHTENTINIAAMRNKDDYKEDDHNKTNNQFEEDVKMCNLQKYIMHSNHYLITAEGNYMDPSFKKF